MSRDAAIDELLTRTALRQLVERYAQAADTRNYEAFRELFVSEGAIHIHHGNPAETRPEYSLESLEVIVKAMSGLEEYEKTQHHVTNHLVTLDGERATGQTYCTAHHIYRKDGAPWNLTMAIRYSDRYVCEKGRWWFEERRLGVDWERHESLGEKGWVAKT